MKKLLYIVICFAFITVITACGTTSTTNTQASTDASKVIKIGASSAPHAEILEQAKPLLAAKGYTLEIVEYQDYVLPNENLVDGELDANYFQHIPYLNLYNNEHGTNIVNAGGIHIEPIGVYSKTYSSIEAINAGTTIILSNSVSDQPRLLTILKEKGLIVLADSVDLTTFDIEDLEDNPTANPKGLKFRNDIDPGLLVQTYKTESNVVVLINTNFALDGGLNPQADALALESPVNNPYVNIIGVRAGDENNAKIKALVEVLKSDEIKNFLITQYQGAVIPA